MKENKNKNKKIKTIKTIIAIIILIILLIIVVGYLFIKSKFDKVKNIEINKEEIGVLDTVEENLQEFSNIVLFGIDSRQIESYDKRNRSDCIIIASLNNKIK